MNPASSSITSRPVVPAEIELTGIGLHSGQHTTVKIYPTAVGSGRVFVRTDLPDEPEIPALVESVHTTTLSTELQVGKASVRTVEHLLASLTALGVDNARIEIDGAEVPLLDGSAKLWVEAIQAAGLSGVMSIGEPVTTAIWRRYSLTRTAVYLWDRF
jgi:UDP-3-O-[3-hydroxymyristoyl] N-acetylglucosamine deacetylase